MPTVRRTVTRGDRVFTVAVSGHAPSRLAARITVSDGQRQIDAGTLELFPESYTSSWRFRMAYRHANVMPVGRVGEVLVGPDAAQALRATLASAEQELVAQLARAG